MESASNILAFAGSLRTESFNKKLVKIAVTGAESVGAHVTYIDLRDYELPIYDEDIESKGLPANARKLKDLFLANQGLLIASPEYNSSFSAALKNLIDWVSRPVTGEPYLNCFEGKTAALMSASPSAFGGIRALPTVRLMLSNIRVLVLPDQVLVAGATSAFGPDGNLLDEKLQANVLTLGRKLAVTVRKLGAAD